MTWILNYPDTSTYIGNCIDTEYYSPGFSSFSYHGFVFYMIRLSSTRVVFMNLQNSFSYGSYLDANDIFFTNTANYYVSTIGYYTTHTFQILSDSLYCHMNGYNQDPCPDGTLLYRGFTGKYQAKR